MWPFNKSLSSSVPLDDDLSEAQIAKFFTDAAPKPTYRDVITSTTGPDGKQVTKHERLAEPVPSQEEPCSLQYYFDEFFMCYTPKSQLRNWYRYGEKKDCGERWRDLKWCVTTRMADEETTQSMLKQRKLDMDKKVHDHPNSEDVWDLRSVPLTQPWHDQNAEQMSIS